MMHGLDRRLLDEFQRDFPLVSRPYQELANRLGCTESEILERLSHLTEKGAISRIGATFRPHTIGCSTLAAMAVPEEEIERVAAIINGFEEVNHNYQRTHTLNIWFVVTAGTRGRVKDVIGAIEDASGIQVEEFPLVRPYRLDLGFPLWN